MESSTCLVVKKNKVVKYNTPLFSNYIFTCNVVHWSLPVNLASRPLLLTALTVILIECL